MTRKKLGAINEVKEKGF